MSGVSLVTSALLSVVKMSLNIPVSSQQQILDLGTTCWAGGLHVITAHNMDKKTLKRWFDIDTITVYEIMNWILIGQHQEMMCKNSFHTKYWFCVPINSNILRVIMIWIGNKTWTSKPTQMPIKEFIKLHAQSMF